MKIHHFEINFEICTYCYNKQYVQINKTKQTKNAHSIIFMMDIQNGFYKDHSMIIIGDINDNEQYMW